MQRRDINKVIYQKKKNSVKKSNEERKIAKNQMSFKQRKTMDLKRKDTKI